MRKLRAKLEQAGFFLFMASILIFAVGVVQEVKIIWVIGLLLMATLLLVVFVRATRAVSRPRRPTPSRQPPKADDSGSRKGGARRSEDV